MLTHTNQKYLNYVKDIKDHQNNRADPIASEVYYFEFSEEPIAQEHSH